MIPGGSRDFTAQVGLYIAPRARPKDLAGLVVSVEEPTTGQRSTATGRVLRRRRGPYGYEIRFDDLGAGQAPPPGVTINLKRLDLRVGAHRRAIVGEGANSHPVTYNLITNPLACDGTWNGRAKLTFSDGSSLERATAIACRRR